MSKAPKTKLTADAGAPAPAEAKIDAAVQTAAEAEGSQTGAASDPAPGEAASRDTSPETGSAEGAADASAATSPPDGPGPDVLALVVSAILHDGEPLPVDTTILLPPDVFRKLAAAGAVREADPETE